MQALSPLEKKFHLQKRREAYRKRVMAKSKGHYRATIPASPGKFAEFVHSLIVSSSPRKRQALAEIGVVVRTKNETTIIRRNDIVTRNIRRKMLQLKKERKGKERKDLRTLVRALQLKSRAVIRSLGMRYVFI
jgi:hypothetical protein